VDSSSLYYVFGIVNGRCISQNQQKYTLFAVLSLKGVTHCFGLLRTKARFYYLCKTIDLDSFELTPMPEESPVTESRTAEFIEEIINDYRLACISREASLLGRKEVLTGKAKFGIFGDGKELAQIAMAKQFQNGDWRAGYYRDQTFMMAIDALSVQQSFAALYAHPDLSAEPTSGGRQMGGHFATRTIDENGNWLNLTERKNSSADISPTAGQMPRMLGLALASKVFRQNPELKSFEEFSIAGNEVAFGTIGDASTSEGLFWETVNAAGVLQVPLVLSVWDDGYGISVPKKIPNYQREYF
jgi:2-oxoisovalerate dehydrogenase E1 component